MFKLFKNYIVVFGCCLMSVCTISCSPDEEDEPYINPTDPSISLSTYEITFQSTGGTRTVAIQSDVYILSATSSSNWLSVSYTNGSVTIIAPANNQSSSRYASVTVTNLSGKSAVIDVTQLGDNNSGGGNGGNDNPGGGNGDNDNPGGGNTQQKPNAPTGVTVSNEGNDYIPDVRVRWNTVSDATSYYVYKSTSASGSYSKIGESSYAQYGLSDPNPPTNGKSAYYKVKAVNSAGESAFSDYAKYTSATNDEAFSPAYTYGNCTVSGTTMTLRWTNSTGSGYGKATEVTLRVWNPYSEEWQDSKLSATATSTSFNFSTKIDNDGYVKAGIVVANAKGSFTAGAKVYDTKAKRWLN